MTMASNTFQLDTEAKDFTRKVSLLLSGERLQRDNEFRERVLAGKYPEHWQEAEESYDALHAIIENQRHPLQRWLSESPHYNEMLRLFRSKQIIHPAYCIAKIPHKTVSLETLLEDILSSSILKCIDIAQSGVESFYKIPQADVESIAAKASDILEIIEKHSPVLDIGRIAHQSLERLSQGIGIGRKPLVDGHIRRNNKRFRPEKRHSLADREIVIRYVVDKYIFTFGRYGAKKSEEMESDFSDGNICNVAPYFLRTRRAGNSDRRSQFPMRVYERNIIHSDVITSLLQMVPCQGTETISERKIQEYAKKQKFRLSAEYEVEFRQGDG